MPHKILIVDDEPATDLLMRQIFRHELKKGDYTLRFAQDGSEALSKLREEEDFGVVVTDLNMPGMDGMTLLGHLRDQFPAVKVLIVSAYNDREKIEHAEKNGAFGFINKPIRVPDLKDRIRSALGI
jgi:CheY-like chemotaxis protein